MLETAAIFAAGYAGYAEWPWWSAALMGAAAGMWNATRRYLYGGWRERLEAQQSGALSTLVTVNLWTGGVTAGLLTALYFVVSWISDAL